MNTEILDRKIDLCKRAYNAEIGAININVAFVDPVTGKMFEGDLLALFTEVEVKNFFNNLGARLIAEKMAFEAVKIKNCSNCAFSSLDTSIPPCNVCEDFNKWELPN